MTRIEIFADLSCPWCYIAERRLDLALAHRPGRAVEKMWRPFVLHPNLPPEGIAWPEYVDSTWGGVEQAGPMFERLRTMGEVEGIQFDWERVRTAPNTVDAHRLILYAERRGREWPLADALFRAYFAEGRDLNDRDTLTEIAAGKSLDPVDVRALLEGTSGAAEVEASRRAATELGVEAVPFFVFDGTVAVSGAQPVELFLEVLDRCELQDAPVS
ncbi:MAG: DsbA family oxidoreductase [Gemmatimonadaceae bacterium]